MKKLIIACAVVIAIVIAIIIASPSNPSSTVSDVDIHTEIEQKKETSINRVEQSMIKLTTSQGEITIELDFENAPKSAENFQQYCEDGFYEGTIFHRVINGFMIQGGGMTEDMMQKETRAPIENEADNGLKNLKGTLAMARTGDPHSATAQFFINVSDNDFLDHRSKDMQGWGYAVFGKVVEGMDVVDQIKLAQTGNSGMHRDVPVEPIVIEKCEIVED